MRLTKVEITSLVDRASTGNANGYEKFYSRLAGR